ncbi:P-loop containing nucleoside triphosphate hydrolase protein, partial [Ochromonadaceae sp. CCMP2298]
MSKHIQVCCRIRQCDDPDVFTAGEGVEVRSKGVFEMDRAFGVESQEQIYEAVVRPMVRDAFTGFNCSLFSYGQTGSGKTHTLIGGTGDNRGIIPRAAEQIFAQVQALEGNLGTGTQKTGNLGTSCHVKLSVLEVYQEQLKDLLSMQTGANYTQNMGLGSMGMGLGSMSIGGVMGGGVQLRIREQVDGTVWVEGLIEEAVQDEEGFKNLLGAALRRRVVGAHGMNDVSSRSHLCCIVTLHQVWIERSQPSTGVKISSKVHLVDLAGSEMVVKTGAKGVRFSEARHINKSLSALGNVISALSG